MAIADPEDKNNNDISGRPNRVCARTLEEAVLWHGGKAHASKDAFVTMDEGDRAALVWFLKSL